MLECIITSFKIKYTCLGVVPTWSYSEAPGYRGHPRNSSAITQPRDHMSIASQNGKPRMISGALKERKHVNNDTDNMLTHLL
jgi:hypothetical protein